MEGTVAEGHEIPQPGDLLVGKYLVERQLGAGGMGVVLAARHVDLGEHFAIKVVGPSFARHPEAVARFLREARAAARIKSEHVARVHDVGRLDSGAPYMVMEHLSGVDLDHVVRDRGALPVEEALDYVLQACEAIAEAHAMGIIHRDLKPANLFLTRRADGSALVKVLDFGMSKITAPEGTVPEQSLTATATLMGSPYYMSPEQVRSARSIDARSDVWSLGVILHKLLTGQQVFAAETLTGCLAKIVADPPARLRDHRPDAPPGLEALILRSLEKDVSRRLQSVAVLAQGLLPFAPASRLSVERIVKVLGLPEKLDEQTLPLAPVGRAPHVVASTQLIPRAATLRLADGAGPTPAPPVDRPPPASSVSGTWTPATLAAPKRTGRMPIVVAGLVAVVGLGAVVARLASSGPPQTPAAAATGSEAQASPLVVTSTPASVTPTSSSASEPPSPAPPTWEASPPAPSSATLPREKAVVPSPDRPRSTGVPAPKTPDRAVDTPKREKRKVGGPIETDL